MKCGQIVLAVSSAMASSLANKTPFSDLQALHHHVTSRCSSSSRRRRSNSRSASPTSRNPKPQEILSIHNESQPRRLNHHGSDEIITIAQIEAVACRRGLSLKMHRLGPFFNVDVLDLQTKEVVGTAKGFVRIWINGRILHLDSIRVKRPSSSSLSPSSRSSLSSPSPAAAAAAASPEEEKQEQDEKKAGRPLLGLSLLLGAAAVCIGVSQKCTKAELLAINDSDDMHAKLVRYYTRMGFRSVYHVTGESLRDFPHMLVWGGVGTRMDASIKELLLKWSPAFEKIL